MIRRNPLGALKPVYDQLLVILVSTDIEKHKTITFPAVFIFQTEKTTESYINIFQNINDMLLDSFGI